MDAFRCFSVHMDRRSDRIRVCFCACLVFIHSADVSRVSREHHSCGVSFSRSSKSCWESDFYIVKAFLAALPSKLQSCIDTHIVRKPVRARSRQMRVPCARAEVRQHGHNQVQATHTIVCFVQSSERPQNINCSRQTLHMILSDLSTAAQSSSGCIGTYFTQVVEPFTRTHRCLHSASRRAVHMSLSFQYTSRRNSLVRERTGFRYSFSAIFAKHAAILQCRR